MAAGQHYRGDGRFRREHIDPARHARWADAVSWTRDVAGTHVDVDRFLSRPSFSDAFYLFDVRAGLPCHWGVAVDGGRHGVKHKTGARVADGKRIGNAADQGYVNRVVIPSLLDAIELGQPVVHSVEATFDDRFMAYEKLMVPAVDGGRISYVAIFTRIKVAVEQALGPEVGELSARERECLSLVASGYPSKAIGHMLGISKKTVDLHLSNAKAKLGAKNLPHAIALAMARSLAGFYDASPPG